MRIYIKNVFDYLVWRFEKYLNVFAYENVNCGLSILFSITKIHFYQNKINFSYNVLLYIRKKKKKNMC